MRLFIFELKKLVFSRRSLFTLALLAALIIGLFLRNIVFQELVIEEQDSFAHGMTDAAATTDT